MLITAALKAYFSKVHGKTVTGSTIAAVINNGATAVGAVAGLPAVTASDDGKILKVVDGEWTVTSAT